MATSLSSVLLAVDAGGSHTRAVLVDGTGALLGYGLSTSGNPTAVGPDEALRAIGTATRAALAQAGVAPSALTRVVLAAAGEQGLLSDAALRGELAAPGSRVDRVLDILAMYHSAAVEPDGVALVAGTGAIAARFSHLVPQRVVDGAGWLVGDVGSGFWIGREVACAVVADLDGSGPSTPLTRRVLSDVGLALPDGRRGDAGHRAVLEALVRHVYDDKPVRLARFAPHAFLAVEADEVSARIVAEAEAALAHTLRVAREGHEQLPVVLGGSVIARGILGSDRRAGGPLAEALDGADVRWVHEGAAGAAVVGLLQQGIDVSAAMLSALRADIDRARAA